MNHRSTSENKRKKASADLMALSLLEQRPRHGYELAKLIELRSGGEIAFQVASLYTLLYRLEDKGLIRGRWVEKAGERRRRFYRLTPEGSRVLAEEQRDWLTFVRAVERVIGDPAERPEAA